MKPIPCKDCICLPICKAQANDYINEIKHAVKINPPTDFISFNLPYTIYQSILCCKCDLIKVWFYNKDDIFEYLNVISKLFCSKLK